MLAWVLFLVVVAAAAFAVAIFAIRSRHIHPGLILAALDAFGLVVASYLSVVELQGGVPVCGPVTGCEEVAKSEYAWIGGIPVAVFGVGLSIILLVAALGWWRTGDRRLLAVHYGLSLVGVTFEGYFTFVQVVVIEAVCIWCAMYGVSLILRFVIALIVWLRRDQVPEGATW
ncbi:MAG: vitamin K epoxide reductase family protein [Chloroflexota bacterium]